jgi:hypothetical protein
MVPYSEKRKKETILLNEQSFQLEESKQIINISVTFFVVVVFLFLL